MDEVQGVVVDNGSFTIKSGFAGDDAPRSVIPSVVGTKKYKDVMFLGTPTVCTQFYNLFTILRLNMVMLQ